MASAAAGDVAATGIVVDIQHFSTHDGPGIRTTVFLKGCSLRCAWCCNPETIAPAPELGCNTGRCIGVADCGRCLPACSRGALRPREADGRIEVDRGRCDDCGACADACPSRALYRIGRTMSVAEVLAEAERDGAFYGASGGGLTLSGGECLRQPRFSAALLGEARRRGLTTAIETAGNVPWPAVAEVLPHADTVLHDYKLDDGAAHRRWTGADNALILANYRRAYSAFPDIVFVARIPLMAGVNDSDAQIDAVLDAVEPYPNVVAVELLPYHDFGGRKYGVLGRMKAARDLAAPAPERVEALRRRIGLRRSARQEMQRA